MPHKSREVRLAYYKKWYMDNKEYVSLYCKKYQKLNRKKLTKYSASYRIKNPWLVSYTTAEQRCNNKNHHAYKYYGGRGIKFLLTKEEIKYLYERDFACLMKWPTIDRINNDGNYELSNCRFIEMGENSRRAHKGIKRK